jgi:hypothetical protein
MGDESRTQQGGHGSALAIAGNCINTISDMQKRYSFYSLYEMPLKGCGGPA